MERDEIEKLYIEALNDVGDIIIGSLHYDPAFVLKKIDPIAYEIGLSEYADSMEEGQTKYIVRTYEEDR